MPNDEDRPQTDDGAWTAADAWQVSPSRRRVIEPPTFGAPETLCSSDPDCGAGVDDCCAGKGDELVALGRVASVRHVLQIVLAINAAMFAVEFTAGLIAGSTALMADSVDMLGDALVYVLSLYALERSLRWRAGAALAKGALIALFGVGVIIEATTKLAVGVTPMAPLMAIFGAIALGANLTCLVLLWSHRRRDVNLSSTFECSRNDVIANVGVLAAAGGVALMRSPWPDVLVGLAIAALFLRSAVQVLRTAWAEFARSPPEPQPEHALAGVGNGRAVPGPAAGAAAPHRR